MKRKIGNIKEVKPGKYRIRISCGFDDFGKRLIIDKTVDAKSETEAEKIMIKLYSERDKTMRQARGKINTLGALFDEFFEIHVRTLAPGTQEYYRNTWKLLSGYSDLKTDNINLKNIKRILEEVPEGKRRNSCYKMLSSVFKFAIRTGSFTGANPCELIDAPKYKTKEKKIPSEQELRRCIDHIEEEEIKYQCIFLFACLLGMRRQEILALTWDDIDFNKQTVFISKAAGLSFGTADERMIIKNTKTAGSVRKLWLPGLLIEKLKRLKKEQTVTRLKLGSLYQNKNFLFTKWDGGLMSIQTPSQWWKKFSSAHGIEGITLHGLRHFAASVMINAGTDIATVSKTLGHSNISTTLDIYTHLIEDSKKNALQSIAEKVGVI